jgi:hypothetical protein
MAYTSTTDRQGWVEGLDRLTKDREGQDVTIEVLDRSFGDQTEAERLPFAYTSYDPKGDVVVVAVGGRSSSYPVVLRHMVRTRAKSTSTWTRAPFESSSRTAPRLS